MSDARKIIESGESFLGIEFGSTRIKAVLIDATGKPLASGAYDWENDNIDGVWTYSLEEIENGLAGSYADLKKDVEEQYGVKLTKLKAMGVSAMMHGFLGFDKEGNLLTPFRTWRNNITEAESEELTALFDYPIAQRWSISHLLMDVKKDKEYLKDLDHFSTLAVYAHQRLTGLHVAGIGDASGMFPIDTVKGCYLESALEKFNKAYLGKYSWKLEDVLPGILFAGQSAGTLTEEGAKLLDRDGELEAGCPLCPPEGDAGTGMVATNSVRPRTGNVSAGTSAFAMAVLEKPLSKAYSVLDLVTTPDGRLVAMAHSNNCTGSYDAWFNIFNEVLETMGVKVKKGALYDALLNKALEADPDCGGVLSYGYISGEHITGFSEGRPLVARHPEGKFNLANLVRSELYTALSAMATGLNLLFNEEGVTLDVINGHGGYFKTEKVGQVMVAAATNVPCKVLATAGEGGAWGIAILAAYLFAGGENLADYLDNTIFKDAESDIVYPDEKDVEGYKVFFKRYHQGLAIEKAAVESLTLEA